MKALLTGITGNIGSELARDLTERGIKVLPIVRAQSVTKLPVHVDPVIEADLLGSDVIPFSGSADCIVHCAGDVHFTRSERANERMMNTVIALARVLNIPIYYVSTAFVFRPTNQLNFNNSYEEDKYKSEQTLVSSGIPHAIFRPSVITGRSSTGYIQNFSGYYFLVRAFIEAVSSARTRQRRLRFPKMTGVSNMVPVDEVARHVGEAIQNGRLEMVYVTNPNPPDSQWVLEETLSFLGVRERVDLIDVSLEDYAVLSLSDEEATLLDYAAHFAPYWSQDYSFPRSVCSDNLITREYLSKALSYFCGVEHRAYEPRNH